MSKLIRDDLFTSMIPRKTPTWGSSAGSYINRFIERVEAHSGRWIRYSTIERYRVDSFVTYEVARQAVERIAENQPKESRIEQNRLVVRKRRISVILGGLPPIALLLGFDCLKWLPTNPAMHGLVTAATFAFVLLGMLIAPPMIALLTFILTMAFCFGRPESAGAVGAPLVLALCPPVCCLRWVIGWDVVRYRGDYAYWFGTIPKSDLVRELKQAADASMNGLDPIAEWQADRAKWLERRSPGRTFERRIRALLERLACEHFSRLRKEHLDFLRDDLGIPKQFVDRCVDLAIFEAEAKRKWHQRLIGAIGGFLQEVVAGGPLLLLLMAPLKGTPVAGDMVPLSLLVFFWSGLFLREVLSTVTLITLVCLFSPIIRAGLGWPGFGYAFFLGCALRAAMIIPGPKDFGRIQLKQGTIPTSELVSVIEREWKKQSTLDIAEMLGKESSKTTGESHIGEMSPQSE